MDPNDETITVDSYRSMLAAAAANGSILYPILRDMGPPPWPEIIADGRGPANWKPSTSCPPSENASATNNKGAPAREGIPMGRYEPMTITRQRRAERELAQRNPAWKAWLARTGEELAQFITVDVPALSRLADPYTRDGLQIAEDAAHDLFECTWSTFLPRITERDLEVVPAHMLDIVMEYRWQSVREHPELHVQLEIADEHGALARRWERFVGEVFRRAFEGTWLNAPAWAEGPRDESGVLPVIEYPWDPIAPQRYEVRGVLSMAPWMNDWHHRTLQRLWDVEVAPHTAWTADGRPRDNSWTDPEGS